MCSMKRIAIGAALAMSPVATIAQDAASNSAANAQADPYATIDARLPPDAQAAVTGINAFSIDLYRLGLRDGTNLFLSPASVSTAVALAYRGAAGRTADELRKVLHYAALPDAYFRASAAVFATMTFSGNGRLLQAGNAIWVQDGMPLKPDYLADIATSMKAGVQRTDFAADPEKSRVDINRAVATATHDRVARLLEPGVVTHETRGVLVNTIYWKGRWQHPFPADATLNEPFWRLGGGTQSTRLMHQRGSFVVVERNGVQAITLPYVGGEVDMTILLPRAATGLPKLEAGLTGDELARWFAMVDHAAPRDSILTLPRMHLEWQRDLKDTLIAMGAPTPFGDDADFTGMVTFPYPGSRAGEIGLKISHVIHQARLDVDEQGAEAAAATAVMDVAVTAMRRGPPPPPPIVFRANRPFFFLLRDRRTGLILFMGRYVAPPT